MMNNDEFSYGNLINTLTIIVDKALREHITKHWFASLSDIKDHIKEKYESALDMTTEQGLRIWDYILCEKMFEIVGPSLLADVDRWVDIGAKEQNLTPFGIRELRKYLTLVATEFNFSRFKRAGF